VHVVVLAAGCGSRLGALGDRTPKWLLSVGGRTLADRQLEAIGRADGSVASVRVVVGHSAEAIERELAQRAEPVGVVANPEFAELNNWWSLLRALRELPAAGPVVVINADLLAEPEHVARFLEQAATGDADGLLAVDLVKRLTDESMKVALNADATLCRIGKVGIVEPAGEYVGMLMARGEALRRLRDVLEGFVGHPPSANQWYEGAVGQTAAAGTAWHVWAMPPGGWVEIDDDADLEIARSLVAP
jgi:choline kinase